MNKLRFCKKCYLYTLEDVCPSCSKQSSAAHPVKYSKEDKYAEYRRKQKFTDLVNPHV